MPVKVAKPATPEVGQASNATVEAEPEVAEIPADWKEARHAAAQSWFLERQQAQLRCAARTVRGAIIIMTHSSPAVAHVADGQAK